MGQNANDINVLNDLNAPKSSKEADLAQVPRITSVQQRQALIQNNRLVVIDNYTDWCGPCKQCAPSYAVLSDKYSKSGVCVMAKENVDDKCGGLPTPVRGVPCFHFYMNGQFLDDEVVTGADISALEQTIERLLDRL